MKVSRHCTECFIGIIQFNPNLPYYILQMWILKPREGVNGGRRI